MVSFSGVCQEDKLGISQVLEIDPPCYVSYAGPSLSKTPTHPMVAHMKASQSLRQNAANMVEGECQMYTTFAWVWRMMTNID